MGRNEPELVLAPVHGFRKGNAADDPVDASASTSAAARPAMRFRAATASLLGVSATVSAAEVDALLGGEAERGAGPGAGGVHAGRGGGRQPPRRGRPRRSGTLSIRTTRPRRGRAPRSPPARSWRASASRHRVGQVVQRILDHAGRDFLRADLEEKFRAHPRSRRRRRAGTGSPSPRACGTYVARWRMSFRTLFLHPLGDADGAAGVEQVVVGAFQAAVVGGQEPGRAR